MRRRVTALLGLVGSGTMLMLWLAAAPIASAGDPCYHGFAMPEATVSTENEIKLAPCAFSPTVANVDVGETVTFFNGPDFTHLITGANQAWGSRDVEVAPGKQVSYTFDKAGVYAYSCALHRGMSGVIVVGDAATALAATAGSTSGTTGTTGSTTSGAATNGNAAPTTPTTTAATTSSVDIPIVAAISLAVGALFGAAIAWFALRRRAGQHQEPVAGVA